MHDARNASQTWLFLMRYFVPVMRYFLPDNAWNALFCFGNALFFRNALYTLFYSINTLWFVIFFALLSNLRLIIINLTVIIVSLL